MPTDQKIDDFIQKGLDAGIPHQSLVGILASQGWPEKEVYSALAAHYRRVSGLEIPRRASAAASAKEAFFYLLIFSALATWTVGFGCLAFTLIDRWFADPLFLTDGQSFDTYTITYSLAALIVAFPLYLLISRIVVREAATHPDKLDSSVRKWLTYMALVIAAAVFTGDLIGAIAYLLRGELTSRFLAKSFVVLALSGGVFFYYFGGLRKSDAAAPARSHRDISMAVLSSLAVIVVMVLGFRQIGSPNIQRELRADAQRVNHLSSINTEINLYWKSHSSQLPQAVTELPVSYADPISRTPYEYHPGRGSEYELCANFESKSESRKNVQDPWSHPAGHYCFTLDATMTVQYAPVYLGY